MARSSAQAHAAKPGRQLSPASKSAKLASIAQWDAMLARYPPGEVLDLVSQAIFVLCSNAIVLHLVWTGKVRPIDLVLLVTLEAILLTTISWVQMRFVPESALMEKPKPFRQRLGVLLFGLVWLGGVYGIIFGGFLGAGPQVLEVFRNPWETLRSTGLIWPLAISALGAAVDSVRDWMFWRSRGGFFLSTPGFYAMARWLTLFLGGIPFFVPFAALAGGAVTLFKRLSDRLSPRVVKDLAVPAGAGRAQRFRISYGSRWIGAILVLGALLAFSSVFRVVGWLMSQGVTGWAIGYCSAKFLSEGFITFLPFIASRARQEEAAGLAGKSGTAPG
ncbi:MAG: hypothetical protein ABI639_01570 [Thermoanaerobaculia bacterium]